MTNLFRAFACTALLAITSPALAGHTTYSITHITTQPELADTATVPTSINDAGTIAFWTGPTLDPDRTSQSFSWRDGAATPIPTPAGHAITFH
jgi:hypothetical protein